MLHALRAYALNLMQLGRSRTAAQIGLVTAGNLLSAVLRFASCLILAKQLTAVDWGYLVVFIAVMDSIAVLCDNGINPTTVKFIAEKPEAHPRPVIIEALMLKVLVTLLVAGGAIVGGKAFLAAQQIPATHAYLYPVSILCGLLLSFITFSISILQARQAYASYALGAAFTNVIRFIAVCAVVMLGVTTTQALYAAFYIPLPIAAVVVISAVAYYVTQIQGRSRSGVGIRRLIRFMAPVAILNLAALVLTRLDVFLLQAMTSPQQVANYGLAYQVAFIFPILAMATFTSLLPKVASMREARLLRSYRRKVLYLYPAMLAIGVFAALVAPYIIGALFGDKYGGALPVISILILAFAINMIYHPLGLIFYALDRPEYVTAIQIVEVPVLVVTSLLLIPHFGAVGSALSALLVRVVGVTAILIFTERVVARQERIESAA